MQTNWCARGCIGHIRPSTLGNSRIHQFIHYRKRSWSNQTGSLKTDSGALFAVIAPHTTTHKPISPVDYAIGSLLRQHCNLDLGGRLLP